MLGFGVDIVLCPFLVADCETVNLPLADDQDLVGFELCLEDIRGVMELRHLRYFVAVAEEGSLLTAAQRRLNTSQPSLSRQIRDLEAEVGVQLLERQARGVTLTAAGRVFLDHARLALLQVEAATEAARQTAQPQRPVLSMGFLVGLEVMWLPQLLRILREEAPDVEVTLSTQSSPELALALMRGKLDIAFLRPEKDNEGVVFKILAKEPLIAVLPAEHRLASRKKIRPQDLAREIYVSSARTSPVLQEVIQNYASRVGITLKAKYEGENISSAMSLVASTGGISLVPLYAQNMLAPNVVARALEGGTPTVDLALGYNRANPSPLLRRLLSRADELVANVQNQSIIRYVEAQ
ncbi:LysR family hca operon transcriptional activator [Bradyrhizobium sp. USDA 377]